MAAAELHTDGIGIDGSAVAVTRRPDQSRLQPFLVQAADAASTQRGLERSEVVDRRGCKGAVIFPQNVTVFDASPQPEMRDMDEGKEAFEIFFFLPPPLDMMMMRETQYINE